MGKTKKTLTPEQKNVFIEKIKGTISAIGNIVDNNHSEV